MEAASVTDTWAQLQAFDRVGDRWVPRFDPIDARIGRSGVSADHREGDGTTPAGTFTLRVTSGVTTRDRSITVPAPALSDYDVQLP